MAILRTFVAGKSLITKQVNVTILVGLAKAYDPKRIIFSGSAFLSSSTKSGILLVIHGFKDSEFVYKCLQTR
jgi:hypothetical protein